VPKNDKIDVKPVLLQKGRTKLAIFGLSNLRDERLFREFRNGKVKFFRPSQQKDEWFNLMVVHQNHHSRTPTGYLPESFLPNFLDLVVWGHEHDCEIEPRYVEEQGFHVIQPGSSVATQLTKGETIPKKVAILTVKGKEFKVDPIPLRTVRPFIFKEIVLADEKELKNTWKKSDNRMEISRHLRKVIQKMIDQANKEWLQQFTEADIAAMEDKAPPKPLIRLRVDYSAPEGGVFDCENSQRITVDFMKTIANHNNAILFYQKKRNANRGPGNDIDIPEHLLDGADNDGDDGDDIDSAQMGKLVREFLEAQSLTVFPQNLFGDAVTQFVDKDDKDAMSQFVTDSLKQQVDHMMNKKDESVDVDILKEAMEEYRLEKEKLFAESRSKGIGASSTATAVMRMAKHLKPRPDDYDSDFEGPWEDNPDAVMRNGYDDSDVEMISDAPPTAAGARNTSASRARGRGRGRGAASASSRATTKKPISTRSTGRGRKNVVDEEEEEENESDVNMQVGSDLEDESQPLFVPNKRDAASKPAPAAPRKAASTRTSKATAAKASAASGLRQSVLGFQSQAGSTRTSPRAARSGARKAPVIEISDDDIEDDEDDAFESLPAKKTTRRR
jgi:double-strand break repair protein MRE11